MNNLGHLPTELMLSIAKNVVDQRDLYTCTLINKRFHAVTNPVLWRSVRLTSPSSLSQIITTMQQLAQSPGRHVRHVSFLFAHLPSFGDQFLLFIRHVAKLESLAIAQQHLHSLDTQLQHLEEYCPNLKTICLSRGLITRNTILTLSRHCHQLATLDLIHCVSVEHDIFTALATCPLETMSLQSTQLYGLDSDTMDDATSNSAILDLAGLHRLTYLWVLDASPFDCSSFMATTHDRQGNVMWPDLKSLFLPDCALMNDALLIQFIKLHPQLEHFHFVSGQLTDATLDAIARWLPNIKTLSLDNNKLFTNEAVRRLVKHCSKLTTLGLDGCQFLWTDFPEQAPPPPPLCKVSGNKVTKLERVALDAIRLGSVSDDNNNNDNDDDVPTQM